MADQWTAYREVAEVLGSFSATAMKTEVARAVAEVLGFYDIAPTRKFVSARTVVEVIGTMRVLSKGFDLPHIPVTNPTVFMVVLPVGWSNVVLKAFNLSDNNMRDYVQLRSNPASATTLIAETVQGLPETSRTTSTASVVNVKQLVTWRFNATPGVTEHWVNGVAQTETPTGASFTLRHLDGLCKTALPDYVPAGYIAEVLVYNRSLTEPERLLVQTTLAAKWGI